MSVYKRTIDSKDGKKSLNWYVEVSSPNGKKIKRGIGKVSEMTKAVVRQVEQALKRKVKLGQSDMIQANIPMFNEFIPEFTEHQRNIKRNRDCYRPEHSLGLFAKYFSDKKLCEFTPSDIDDYKRIRLAEGKQPATVNRELAAVRTLYFLAKKGGGSLIRTRLVSQD